MTPSIPFITVVMLLLVSVLVPSGALTDSPSAIPTIIVTSEAIVTSDPTSSPIAANVTSVPSSSPTRPPSTIPTTDPSSSPTDSPSAIPTTDPSSSPTDSPTTEPSAAPTPGSQIRIISGLSTSNETFCLNPARNNVVAGNKIVISSCKDWSAYQWIVDDEGKFRNYKDPDFCIHVAQRMILTQCIDGATNQTLTYSSHGRLVAAKNGRKGLAVVGGVAPVNDELELVKLLNYVGVETPDHELWELENFYGIIPLPNVATINIKSHLTDAGMEWCVTPLKWTFNNNFKMVVAVCNTWTALKWTMDNQGKIVSVKDSSKCIEGKGKRMVIAKCNNKKSNQRFAYSVLEERLTFLKKGSRTATVEGGVASDGALVRLLDRGNPVPSSQKWTLEQA